MSTIVLMKIIADTNIFIAVALGEKLKGAIIDATESHELFSPEILPYEIANALSKMVRRSILEPENAQEAYRLTELIPVNLHSVNISEALTISSRFKIYAYDAFFLQTAISLNGSILTIDKQMLRIAKELNIKNVELK